MLFSQLKKKEVINVPTGLCLGFVSDLMLDPCGCSVEGIIVPPVSGGWLQKCRRKPPLLIPLSCVERIGSDVILVHVEHFGTLPENGA